MTLGKRGILTVWETGKYVHRIIIDDNVNIGDDFYINSINESLIGKNVLMGKKVIITDNSHGAVIFKEMDIAPIDRTKGPVIIEDNVWIGDTATILSNVTIGKCSVVGANSLVYKNVPPYRILWVFIPI